MSLVLSVFALGLVVVLVIGYLSYLQAKKRREALAALTASRGWTFTARDDSWGHRYQGSPFGLGYARRALNVIEGDYDRRAFVAFDYEYSTSEGTGEQRHTETHRYSIVAIHTPTDLPELAVTPEGWFGRLVGRISGADIQLESEAFNRAFTVTCPDRRFATDVLHPRMMDLLLGMPDLGWSLRGGSLVVATPGQHDLPRLDALLTSIDRIIDHFPGLIWRERGVVDPGTGGAEPAGPAGA